MATNSPFARGSTSSLLRSANSLAATIADYQDRIKAFDWSNSAYTDDAFNAYASYLQERITKLQATGTIADAGKALTLMGTLKSANHSNISASIQRENIQIMAGGANLTDKYNLVARQFQRALDNGDLTLAQSLESQAYSISQSIQYQAQQKQLAGEANARAAAASANRARTASAKGESNTVKDLQAAVKQFSTDYVHAGQKSLDKTTAAFVKSITPTLNALGVYFPANQKPNYFDIVDGVNQAIFKHYTNIAEIWNGIDDDKAQSAVDKAQSALQSIKTAFGDMDVNQLAQAAADPGRFHLTPDPEFAGTGQKGPAGATNPQIGYQFNAKLDALGRYTGVQAVFSHNPAISVPNDAAAQINALGLRVVGGKGGTNGVQVVATNGDKAKGIPATPAYLKKVLPPNTAVHLVYGPTGVQFEGDAVNGEGKAVFSLTKDASGKQAVYESSAMGDRLVGGDKGYNPFDVNGAHYNPSSGQHQPTAFNLAHSGHNLNSKPDALAGFVNSAFGTNSPQGLINSAQAEQGRIAAANAAAARAMLALPPPPLPPIRLAAPAAAAPLRVNNAPVAQKISIPTYGSPAIAPKTVNPQPGAVSPQKPGAFNLQGGGGIRLQ